MKTALTYDDIQLIPDISNIQHRGDISLKTLISRRYGLLVPLIASPMDTICEVEMAKRMMQLGGVGCIHRFMSIKKQSEQVSELRNTEYYTSMCENWGVMYDDWHADIKQIPVMAAIGVKPEDRERAYELTNAGANILLIDVAHGHHTNVFDMVVWCKKNLPDNIDIIAGNIVTKDAVEYLEYSQIDGLRVGIGGGSLCTTRIQTGFGVPNVTAIEDVASYSNVPIIADGGIRTSGDIAKALSLGASSVMLGSLLAGTEETPGKIIENTNTGGLYKRYRGSASLETKISHNQMERNVEGESTVVPFKGGAKFVINGLIDGVKSALSYNGSRSLGEFNPKYNVITNSGLQESKPHLIK